MNADRLAKCLAVVALGCLSGIACADADYGALLEKGPALAETELVPIVAADPADDSARLALGMAQSMRAVEKLGGNLYTYGYRSETPLSWLLPIAALPVEANPEPKPITAAAIDSALEQFEKDMAVAIRTLREVDDASAAVVVRVGLIPVDMNGEAPGGAESAWKVLTRRELLPRDIRQSDVESFAIRFDLADARWLEGYCHLLSAMADVITAYEKKELVERTGHLIFARTESPYQPILSGRKVFEGGSDIDLMDAIAMIHLLNFELRDAGRMKQARLHLLETLKLSRASWAAARAETDDDREWIPNAKQTSMLPQARLTEEVIDGWLAFVDDCEAALEGKLLVPLWRGDDTKGVNLKRVFDEPRRLDVVLWVQGTDALPYLEEGKQADGASYRRLERLLQGDFLPFALWVN